MKENGESISNLTVKAQHAYAQKDFTGALQQWSLMRTLFPQEPSGYWGTGEALRELRMFDEADYWLREGIRKFPQHYLLQIGFAWSAAHRGDWEEAQRRFAAALPLSENNRAAHFGIALALFRQGRLAQAKDILLSLREGERADAIELLAAINKQLAPEDDISPNPELAAEAADEDGLVARIDALCSAGRFAEAEDVFAAGLRLFPESATLLIGYARAAERTSDWAAAIDRWAAVKTIIPGKVDGYIGSANALLHIGKATDAELVSAPAARLFPDDAELLRVRARAAAQRKDWNEAAKRWRNLQALEPGSPDGWVGESAALRQGGDEDAAERLTTTALQRFEHELPVWIEHARSAEGRRSWDEARARWQIAQRRFPHSPEPWLGLIWCDIESGQLDQAEATVPEALNFFPDQRDLLIATAEVATRQKRKEVAEQRWRQALGMAPDSIVAIIGHAKALIAVSRTGDAEQLLLDARKRLTGRIELEVELAKLLAQRRDWEKALGLLAETKRHHGDHHLLRAAITDMLWQVRQDIGVQQAEKSADVLTIPEILLTSGGESAHQAELKQLFLRFESLGDNCEFGMAQRRFGAEPLSLLRWTGTPPDSLAGAIRDRFRLIGDKQHTQLDEVHGEYVTRVPAYKMFAHTFSLSSATPFETFHEGQCKRMTYLRDKLLDDIASGTKILVYGSERLTEDSIDALHEALLSINSGSTLLCVRRATQPLEAGTVVKRKERLLVGAISAFSTTNIAFDEWISICRRALELAGTPAVETVS